MKKSRLLLLGASALSCTMVSQASTHVDANFLATQHIAVHGDLVSAQRVTDKAGEHVLVLSRKQATGAFKLNASYFTRGPTGWNQEWAIRDGVNCPGLDSDASFFPAATSFTDLNHNGRKVQALRSTFSLYNAFARPVTAT